MPPEDVMTNSLGGKQSKLPTRCDLMPPLATMKVAEVLSSGAEKYGEDNWHAISVGEHINHALSHIYACLAANQNPDRDFGKEDHMVNAACRILMALEIRERGGPKKK